MPPACSRCTSGGLDSASRSTRKSSTRERRGAVRLAVDTGGTFTDLVVEGDDGTLHLFKSATTPDDPVQGVLDVLATAAGALGDDLLARGSVFLHATTRAINAVLTGTIARTAFLTTEGHPDVLLFREGGRTDPFNITRPYPEPYVPRALTFQVPERLGAAGAGREPPPQQAGPGPGAGPARLARGGGGGAPPPSVADPPPPAPRG